MKNNTFLPPALVMALALLTLPAIAASAQTGGAAPTSDFDYDLTEDGTGVVIIKYKGRAANLILPSAIEGFPVTELGSEPVYGDGALSHNASLVSVVIPDTVRAIAEGTFAGDTKLRSVTLPKQFVVTYWGMMGKDTAANVLPAGMFRDCKSLTSFTIPTGITHIGGSAFEGSGVTSITVPEGVRVIEHSAFQYCKSLVSVTFPESLEALGAGAFDGCSALTEVRMPRREISWTEYDSYSGMNMLNEGTYTFRGCTKLGLAVRKTIQDRGYKGGFTE